jgi:hypothetical protein
VSGPDRGSGVPCSPLRPEGAVMPPGSFTADVTADEEEHADDIVDLLGA